MMHTKILEKCLEELRKEAPRKDYVIGMLETLVEMDAPETNKVNVPSIPHVDPLPIPDFPTVQTIKVDEILTDEDRAYAAKMAGGRLGKLH